MARGPGRDRLIPAPGPTPSAAEATDWWRRAVIYQVYIRSFADGDGDGVGDIAGIRARLPYLHDLGVDAVWITPWYPSPMADGGYDVADYRDVDPMFGTLAEAVALVREAHDMGLRVLLDLVPNHTSDQHAWFRAALASPPGSVERGRYLFRDGRGPGGVDPPNDWRSVFGGPAWTRVSEADGRPGQWYLHLFAPEQPDLDWTNDDVRDEFASILRFWFDLGVDGFRIDVAHALAKDPGLPDLDDEREPAREAGAPHPHWDRDEVHDVYRAWRAIADGYPGDRMFTGEVHAMAPERLGRYLRPDELHTAFNFAFLRAPWEADRLRAVIDGTVRVLGAVGAPPTWVLSNHDEARVVTRYGRVETGIDGIAVGPPPPSDLTLGTRRARAAALLMLALPGGAFIYQGEELGLPDVETLPDAARHDPMFARSGGAVLGRDGCRVPLPWSGDAPPFGFGPDGTVAWLPQPTDWASLTVERQSRDAASMLSLYRAALAIRRTLPGSDAAPFRWLPCADGALHFERGEGLRCLVNLEAAPVALPRGSTIVLASGPTPGGEVPPDVAVWYRPGEGPAAASALEDRVLHSRPHGDDREE